MVDGDAQGNLVVEPFMMADEDVVGAEVPLTSCMEISMQQVPDGGLANSTESILAKISNCPLKRIDPSLRSGNVEVHTGSEPSRDPLKTTDVSAEDMQFDEGGTAPNSS